MIHLIYFFFNLRIKYYVFLSFEIDRIKVYLKFLVNNIILFLGKKYFPRKEKLKVFFFFLENF
jgi:hypothetical protein